MGKINTDNYPNRPFSSYQDDDMFILQDNGGETYTTNVGDVKNLADSRIKLEGVKVNGTDLPITDKKVNVDISGKTDLSVIAYTFNSEMGYFKGAYVTYNGKLYEFIQEHTGAWNPSHVREIRASGQYVRTGNGGYNNGDRATCEGYMTKASGNYSHAEGRETQAVGDCTHAEGRETIANGIYQHVEGKYNIADNENKYIHIIGNGIDDNNRSNAMTLDWDGNLEVSGDVEDGNGEKISDKTDKVTNATSGHLAGLDSNGNLTDSGVSPTEEVTVEGNPVTFDSPFEQDAKSVVVSVNPIQDLHGYDHPWVGGAGKNKMYCELQLPYDTGKGIVVTSDGNGGVYLNGTSTDGIIIGNVFKTDALTGQSTFCKLTSAQPSGLVYIGHWPNGDYYSPIAGFETAGTDGYWEMGLYFPNSGIVCNNVHLTPMVIMGDTHDTDYAPYSNICPISGIDEVEIGVSDGESEPTTTTIPLPSTLYGGTVDVESGVLTVEYIKKTYNGTEQWAGVQNRRYIEESNLAHLLDYTGSIYCDKLKTVASSDNLDTPNSVSGYLDTTSQYESNWLYMNVSADTGGETFKNWLIANTPEVTFKLKTPIELDITPAILELLEGTNVLTTNGEKVAVTYGRSLWQDIDDLKTDTAGKLDKSNVADVEGDTASRPYAVNEFMLRSDGLYKVTQPIAQNASITASNTTKTTIGAVLTALLNA